MEDFENDFGFETEDDEEIDGLDAPVFEMEITNVATRTAILAKNEMIAILGLQTFDQGGTLCRVDPREERPAVQVYDNPKEALNWYRKSLRTSKQNGWRVVYDGLPLNG